MNTGLTLSSGADATLTSQGDGTCHVPSAVDCPVGNPNGVADCTSTAIGNLPPGPAGPGLPFGAVVGRLGPRGTPFLVGSGPTTVHGPGTLYLLYNDCNPPGGYGDNGGSFKVTVTVTGDSAPPATTPEDTSPPQVKALSPAGVTKPKTSVALHFNVTDDSGRASALATLYDGGAKIRSAGGTGPATGKGWQWKVDLAAGLKGPLFFCAWAKDAAGNSSRGAPQSSCAWVPMLVDIAKVSNGCGGSGWKWFVAGQNYVGNSEVFEEPGGASYTVSFVPACNLHDAGYGGHMVLDSLNGDVPIDYRSWSRKRVDDKFKSDMAKLCNKIPAHAETARIRCRSNWRYNFVRKAGWAFFDADLRKPDVQSEGTRDNS